MDRSDRITKLRNGTETAIWAADEIYRLERERDKLASQVERLRAEAVPNEHGKNRYGLDMAYFRNLINRELNRPLADFMPHELARVFARASRAADALVMQEAEFQPDLAAVRAEAVESFYNSRIEGDSFSASEVISKSEVEEYAKRIRNGEA